MVDGSATAISPGRFRVTTKNANVVSRLPAAMAIWELPLIDLRGRSIDDSIDLDPGELLQLWLWADTTSAPTDLCIAAGFSAGAVASTTALIGVMLQAGAVTSGRWCVHHCGGTGGAYTAAAADSATTRGAVLQSVMGTAVSQARVNAYPVDATKAPITTATSQTSPGSFSSQSNYDRLWVGIGWATGTGGTPGVVDIGIASLVLRPREVVPSVYPF